MKSSLSRQIETDNYNGMNKSLPDRKKISKLHSYLFNSLIDFTHRFSNRYQRYMRDKLKGESQDLRNKLIHD